MPWKNVTTMDEIIRFVSLAKSGRFTVTELCEQFGISRKTGYKHLERYADEGMNGLRVRSHRPHRMPQRTAEQIEALIVAERRLHRTWGPKKLYRMLELKHQIERPPARSTIGEILRRNGLSVKRRRKPGAYEAPSNGLTEATQPNHVWTVDFKGWFNLADGTRCDPLTVCDLYSHFILACRAQPNQQFHNTLCTFKNLMRQVGLPEIIRVGLSQKGQTSPFALLKANNHRQSYLHGRIAGRKMRWLTGRNTPPTAKSSASPSRSRGSTASSLPGSMTASGARCGRIARMARSPSQIIAGRSDQRRHDELHPALGRWRKSLGTVAQPSQIRVRIGRHPRTRRNPHGNYP